ncbi:ATP-binding protein [Streptomyces sp. NPDC004787]|uniref:ATP-binding protein n=1 Tax=Streptomyces sp. NPDC004787 TaxID=3154291 RepID=UPI0033BDBB33
MSRSSLAGPAHTRLEFPADSTGYVRRGLDFTRAKLADWECDTDSVAVGDVLLVAAEMLANAALHAGGPLALDLTLDPDAHRLRIEVTDASTDPPVIRLGRPGEPHGHGLRILDQVTARWGTATAGAGKTVWAELRLPDRAGHRGVAPEPEHGSRPGRSHSNE